MKKTSIAIIICFMIVSCASESPFKVHPDIEFESMKNIVEEPVEEVLQEAEETATEPSFEDVEEIVQEAIEEPSEAVLEDDSTEVLTDVDTDVVTNVDTQVDATAMPQEYNGNATAMPEPKTVLQHLEDTIKGTDEPHEARIGETVLPMWFCYTAAFLFMCILFTLCYIAKQRRFRSYRGE